MLIRPGLINPVSMVISLAGLLLAQTVSAATRADTILAFTGNRHVKAVWTRDAWCDANYNPIASHADGKHINIVVYSTAETGGARTLHQNGDCQYPLITRKDGSQVIWTDRTNSCAWIADFNGTAAKRNLNLGADYEVLTVNYNSATGVENMYVRSAEMKTIYRIPLTGSYAADLSKKTAVITGSVQIDESFSVSGDDIMAGAALPWPDTYIYNMQTKQANSRHTGQFGCNCNIAPDNSYRFFHFGDSHDLIHMFEANLVNSFTDISTLNVTLGNGTIGQQYPRWTSNVNYMSVVSPNHTDDPDAWTFEENAIYGWSASKVQQCPLYMFEALHLGKLGTDFKSVTWTVIAGGDRRNLEGIHGGMVWVAQQPGSVELLGERPARGTNARGPRIAVQGNLVEATFPAGTTGSITLATMSGRTIARASGTGSVSVGNSLAGAFVAKVSVGAATYTTRVTVAE